MIPLLTTEEEILWRRGLDKASSPAEVEMCAKRLGAIMRKFGSTKTDSQMIVDLMEDRRRGIDAYQLIAAINKGIAEKNKQNQTPVTIAPVQATPSPAAPVASPPAQYEVQWDGKRFKTIRKDKDNIICAITIAFGIAAFAFQMYWRSAHPSPPEPPPNPRIAQIDSEIDKLQEERDELDPPPEPDHDTFW
jgi:hypothetical protein